MARKTATVTIDADNRDKGKTFLITEMSADQAEEFAAKALLALQQSNINIPSDFKNMGMAGLARLGLQVLTSLKYDDVKPLMDEMMGCVQIVMPTITRELMEGDGADIEEVSTRLKLRKAFFELQTNFSLAALTSITESAAAETQNF
jgi:hypothetical protein